MNRADARRQQIADGEPHHPGVRERAPLAPGIPTLAELLRERGYRTQAFVDGGCVRADWGFDRGFDGLVQQNSGCLRVLGPWALSWLERHAGSPFFLFIHRVEEYDAVRAEKRSSLPLDANAERSRGLKALGYLR